jgi:diguanylate cyclase (GGDEF)-like protein/PAS domain S-box-containing protein
MDNQIPINARRDPSSQLLIGVLSPLLASSFFSEVLFGAVEEIAYYGGNVIGIQTHDAISTDPRDAYFCIEDEIAIGEVNGLISFANALPDNLLAHYQNDLGIPIVLVSHKSNQLVCPSVSSDNKSGVSQLVEHLVSHGHSKIGFVGCFEQNDIKERLAAYKSAMAAHSLPIDDQMIVKVGSLIEDAGIEGAKILLERGISTTALICATDFIAIGLMKELGKQGYVFPKDQVVVGFDDIEQCFLARPSLTSVRQNFIELGSKAAQLLVSRINGGEVSSGEYFIDTSLVVRRSCGCNPTQKTYLSSMAEEISDPYADLAERIGLAVKQYSRNERKATEVSESVALLIADAITMTEEVFCDLKDSILATADSLWKVSFRYEILEAIRNAINLYINSISTNLNEEYQYKLRCSDVVELFTQSYIRTQDLARTDLYDVLRREYDLSLALLKSPIEGIIDLPFLRDSKTKAAVLGIWENGYGISYEADKVCDAKNLSNVIPIFPTGGISCSAEKGQETKSGSNVHNLLIDQCYPQEYAVISDTKKVPVSLFPPRQLIDLADSSDREITLVLPIKTKETYWGLLALVSQVSLTMITGRDFYFQASILISVALEQRRLMESLMEREKELTYSKNRYQIISQATTDGIFDYNLETSEVYFSDRWLDVLGIADQDYAMSDWLNKVHLDDYVALEAGIAACVGGVSDKLESIHRLSCQDGNYRWFHVQGVVTMDPQSNQKRLLGSIADITERRNLEDQLRHQALHDDLTGLPNRLLIVDRAEQMIAMGKRNHTSVSILFIDLDNFKEVNDAYGHSVGDELLLAVAARLRRVARETDTVGRLAGDEFTILVDNGDSVGVAELLAERVQDVLRAPFHILGRDYLVSASIGIATSGERSAEGLLQDADVAMYQAKTLGKNKYVRFAPSMQRNAHQRLEIEMDLADALAMHQLRVYYQPIFKVDKREMIGMEALVRWQHPTKGLIQPGDFIPVAEESGRLIIDIGRYVLNEACETTAGWNRAGANLDIAVNLSARQVESDEIIMTISEVLSTTGLDPKHLVLEITETAMMHDAEAVVGRMAKLKSLGVRIAIDDFGTGYSSLAYLRRFPVDVLKIDRSFIMSLAESAEDVSVVQTLVALGRTLDLEVVAEGVELESQLSVVAEVGCNGAQGFLLGRPLDHASTELLIGNMAAEGQA